MTSSTSLAPLAALEPRLRRQLDFLVEADRLKGILRASRIADGSRRENVAEHSWHIALYALVLAEWADAEVNVERVLRMLLIHDLVEIDAGDVPLFEAAAGPSPEQRAAAEQAAAMRIFGLLPEEQAADYRALWEEFEAARSTDAQFAKCIDRLQPLLLNVANDGGTWTQYDVDIATVRKVTAAIGRASTPLGVAAETLRTDAVARGWLRPAD